MLTAGTLLLAIPKRVTLSPGEYSLTRCPWRVFFGPPGLVDRAVIPAFPVLRPVGGRAFMNNLSPGYGASIVSRSFVQQEILFHPALLCRH